jgi:hypothetical protein
LNGISTGRFITESSLTKVFAEVLYSGSGALTDLQLGKKNQIAKNIDKIAERIRMLNFFAKLKLDFERT